jgi:alkanesulfonate monooxygenase SsuD/methylene tetrahydromethanopterin reductase-like flavin-dependent oxidoreductase (luciferase family)
MRDELVAFATTNGASVERRPLVAQTNAQAKDEIRPAFKIMRDRIRAEWWGPISRADFEQEADRGSLFCGSPETVARRIATAKTLGIARFDLK